MRKRAIARRARTRRARRGHARANERNVNEEVVDGRGGPRRMTRASDRHGVVERHEDDDDDGTGAASNATTRDAGASASAKRRRLPRSVLAAARPPPVKTTRGKGKKKTTAAAPPRAPPSPPRSSLYDVVTESEGEDEGDAPRAPMSTIGAPVTEARRLTTSAYACVRRVADEALVERARRLRESDARARASSPTPEPPSVPRESRVETPTTASLPSTTTTRETDASRPCERAPAPLETFDDMFSMFVGGTAEPAPAPASDAPPKPPPAPVRRASPPASTTTTAEPARAAKPKLSFAELMAAADDDGCDSDD